VYNGKLNCRAAITKFEIYVFIVLVIYVQKLAVILALTFQYSIEICVLISNK